MIKHEKLFKKIIAYEIIGFVALGVFLWAEEILDFSHYLFGGKETPVNFPELWAEMVVVGLLCIFIVGITLKMMKRIKYLEGVLRVCSRCKRVYVSGKWVPIEDFIKTHSEAELTHGFCPDCESKNTLNYT